MLGSDGYLKITDFGLSKPEITGCKRTYSVCGTPEYLAPEVLFKVGHGKPVDWWTLGALIFEMLTGFPPFYSPNREELLHRIKYGTVKIPSTLSPEVFSLLESLLRKDPERRLGSGLGGSEEIKRHRWFAEVDWDLLLKKQYSAPFTPRLRSEVDVSYFDRVTLSLNLPQPLALKGNRNSLKYRSTLSTTLKQEMITESTRDSVFAQPNSCRTRSQMTWTSKVQWKSSPNI